MKNVAFFVLAVSFLLLSGCVESGNDVGVATFAPNATTSPTVTPTSSAQPFNTTATPEPSELSEITSNTEKAERGCMSSTLSEYPGHPVNPYNVSYFTENRTYASFQGRLFIGNIICLDNGAWIKMVDMSAVTQFMDPSASFQFFDSNGTLVASDSFQVKPTNRTRFTNGQIDFQLIENFVGLGTPSYANVTIRAVNYVNMTVES